MFSQPHILVGTDFSPSSDKAIRLAERLRQKCNGHLHLVYVHQYPEEWNWMTSSMINQHYQSNYKESIKKELATRLYEQVKKCEVRCTQDVLFGDPYIVLTERISKNGMDVLFLGHQGISAHPWQLGGLVSKMASSCTVPLFITKKDGEVNRLAGLLDPTDLPEKIFRVSEELAFLFSSELQFLSIIPDYYTERLGIGSVFPNARFLLSKIEKLEIQKNIRKLIEDKVAPKSSAIVKVLFDDQTRLSDTLAKDLEAERIDFAVTLRHKKGKIEKFLLGSVSRGLMESFSGNLLILPPEEK